MLRSLCLLTIILTAGCDSQDIELQASVFNAQMSESLKVMVYVPMKYFVPEGMGLKEIKLEPQGQIRFFGQVRLPKKKDTKIPVYWLIENGEKSFHINTREPIINGTAWTVLIAINDTLGGITIKQNSWRIEQNSAYHNIAIKNGSIYRIDSLALKIKYQDELNVESSRGWEFFRGPLNSEDARIYSFKIVPLRQVQTMQNATVDLAEAYLSMP